MGRTNYGKKEGGSSQFVVVAPHAAGDDLRTKQIAEAVSRHLNAALVVNDTYIKPKNSRAASMPDRVADFNKLSWSKTREKYLWSKKHPHMKEFYDHISELAKGAREHGDGRAIVVYIHGMSDSPDKVGVDIGFGARTHMVGTRRTRTPGGGRNKGVVRANRADISGLQSSLEGRLLGDHGLKVGIGHHYAAWSRRDGIQFHAGTSDHSFQLEISSLLRKPGNVAYTAKLIADALKEVYKV